jgi:undecaprenyl-diphosphatase
MMNLLKKYKNVLFWFGISWLASIIVPSLVPSLSVVTASTTTTTTNLTETSQLSVLQAIVLGFVQGATEFIPISSTAHLKAIPVFFGWGDPGVAFTAVIQLGSIAAVLWYFWADLSQISRGMIKAIAKSNYNSQDFWLAVGILVGTIPIVVLGLAIKALIPDFDNSVLRSMTAIAIASIIMGLLLGAAEYFGSQKRNFNDLTAKDGIIIGLAQALALIPGVSRSGSTMTAGLFYNLDRATAARFSFLLGIPAITAAGLVELKGIMETGIDSSQTLVIVAGLISSAIFSYLAIAWLIKFLQKRSTWVFVWYRLGFGIFILAAIVLGKV